MSLSIHLTGLENLRGSNLDSKIHKPVRTCVSDKLTCTAVLQIFHKFIIGLTSQLLSTLQSCGKESAQSGINACCDICGQNSY